MIRKLERERDAIAKRRDRLRELVEEWTALEDSCSMALDDLQSAIDRLSEYA